MRRNLLNFPVIICWFSRLASCKVKYVLMDAHLVGVCVHLKCIQGGLRLYGNCVPKKKNLLRVSNRLARPQSIVPMATPCHPLNLRLKRL